MWKKFLFDAVIGGIIIAVTVMIAGMFGAAIGGIIAGLPIRVGASLLLIWYYYGEVQAVQAVRGALFGVFGAVVFIIALYFLTTQVKFLPSIAVSAVLCVVATFIAYALFGGG